MFLRRAVPALPVMVFAAAGALWRRTGRAVKAILKAAVVEAAGGPGYVKGQAGEGRCRGIRNGPM